MRARLAAFLTPILLLVAAVPAAQAVTVVGAVDETSGEVFVDVSDPDRAGDDLRIDAGPTRLLVRERGDARLAAAGACRPRSRRVVVCRYRELLDEVRIDAGAGDDRIEYRSTNRSEFLGIRGGAGHDRISLSEGARGGLRGGPGRDVLRGGPRGDRLSGGDGRDTLLGGAGADMLQGDDASIDADRLDGGPGRDTATWPARRRPVRIDLRRDGPAGARGEGDRLRAVENVAGGFSRDRLVGDDGPNQLFGGPGADVLIGGGGNDVLDAGIGRRPPDSGPDGAADRVSCGAGRDLVGDPELAPMDDDCEQLGLSGYAALSGRPLRVQPEPAGRRRLRVQVHGDLESGRVTRRVVLRTGGRELGRSRLVQVGGERRDILVRLRRRLPERGIVEVVIEGENDLGDDDLGRGPAKVRLAYRLRR